MPVVLYGCETWSITMREERRLRMFENWVLRRIFGSKRDEVTSQWGKLLNEELNDLFSSPNIKRVIKSRRMRWTEHVARGGEGTEELHAGFWWSTLRAKDHLEDPGINGSLILRWIFRKWNGRHGLD